MLKKILIVICLIFCSGCRPISVETDISSYKITSYKGTPSLALLSISNDTDYDITIVDNTGDIEYAFEKSESDIIISPINTGINACQNGSPYKLFSIVEYGNLYLTSKYETTYEGNVGAYGEQSILGCLIRYLSKTDLRKYNFIWYDNLDEMKNALYNGEIDSIITDEVNFNMFKNNGIELHKIEDIQEDYQYKTGYSSFPFYGLFVSNTLINEDQTNFVELAKNIKNSINTYKTNKTTFNEALENADLNRIGFSSPDLISESYNYCGLDFIHAVNDVENLRTILELCDITLDDKIIIR